MRIALIAAALIATSAVLVCLVPLKTVPYMVLVDYEDTETYYDREPYEVTEIYTATVPLAFEAHSYIKTDTIEQRHRLVIGGVVIQDEVVEVPIEIACVDVENTDDVSGTFTVSFSGFYPMFGVSSQTTELELQPGAEETAECTAEAIGDWSYDVTPSSKQVEQERTVIEYRQVQKQRTVTRQRQETRYKKVTLLDYLLHYRANE